LRKFLEWWIDADTGYPIPERAGKIRWFIRADEELFWADSKAELQKVHGPDALPKSVAFYPASVHDNKILLAQDPNYLANLQALPRVDRERLLKGNWNVRAAAGEFFRKEWFGIADAAPADFAWRVRYWDRAATEKRVGNDPDASIGLLLSKDRTGVYWIEDVRKLFATPLTVEKAMRACAEQDGTRTIVAYMQDPGSAGVAEAKAAARALDGFNVRFAVATGDKQTRAKPVSAQAEAGNVRLVRGPWNGEFLQILQNFPTGKHDDEVDALSGAHELISSARHVFCA
jgi:predicted phage terminase large subunit-like protein